MKIRFSTSLANEHPFTDWRNTFTISLHSPMASPDEDMVPPPNQPGNDLSWIYFRPIDGPIAQANWPPTLQQTEWYSNFLKDQRQELGHITRKKLLKSVWFQMELMGCDTNIHR